MENNFFISLVAKLQETQSVRQLNKDIKEIQKQLIKLELGATLDPKIMDQLVKSGQQTGKQMGEGIDKGLASNLYHIKQTIANIIKEFDSKKLSSIDLSKTFNLNRADIDSSVTKQVRELTKEINALSMEVLKTGLDDSWSNIINKLGELRSVLLQFGQTRDLSSFKESLDILERFQGKKIFAGNKSEVLQNTRMSVRELNNQFKNLGVTFTTVSDKAIKLDTIWDELLNISPNLEKFTTFGDQINAIVEHLRIAKEAMYGDGGLQPVNRNEVSNVLTGYITNLENAANKITVLGQQQQELNRRITEASDSATDKVIQNENRKQQAYKQTADAQNMKLKSEMDTAGGKVPLDGSWAKEYQKLMSDVVSSTKRVTSEQAKAEKSTNSLFASFKKNFSFLSYWTSANYIFMTSIRKIKEMVSNVRELEDALVNINYTMELSGRQLKEIGESSLQMAKDLNTSASNVLSAVKLYANAKESADSILQKAQPAIMLSNVTGMTGEDSAKMLQSIMNQFDMTQDDLMEIADTIEMVSQNMAYDFASGIDEIANGIEQSGSVAKAAGLSLQEYVSMLGLVIEKTGQSGSTIGNAYKTILQRITKASATEGTLEEDISAAEKSLRAVGIEVRSTADEFRNLTDIMSDLGRIWDSLSSVEQSNISYNVAGVRQTNILKSLLGYWEDYESLVEKANDAGGTTLKNQEIYAESLAGKLGELSSIWENISNDAISSSFLKGLADAGIGVSSLIEKIGLLKVAGVGAFAFINKGRSKQRFCPVGW